MSDLLVNYLITACLDVSIITLLKGEQTKILDYIDSNSGNGGFESVDVEEGVASKEGEEENHK